MPEVISTTGYPRGKYIPTNMSVIPEEYYAQYDFFVATAADGHYALPNDVGAAQKVNWNTQVQQAADHNMLLIALVILRIKGHDYPIDLINPLADRQLNSFKHSLTDRTHAAVIIRTVVEDSEDAEVKAINMFADQLRKQNGKIVFLTSTKKDWEGYEKDGEYFKRELYRNMVDKADSAWSFCLYDFGGLASGNNIYTPGNWSMNNGAGRGLLLVEGKEYTMFLDKAWNATLLGMDKWPDVGGTQPQPDPEPNPNPNPDDDDDDDEDEEIPVGDDALTKQIYGLRQDLRKIFAGLEPL